MTRPSINDYPRAPQQLPWATWIPDRIPAWKIHATLAQAKNAVGSERHDTYRQGLVRGGVVYQLVDGAWIVRAVVTPWTPRADHIVFTRAWNEQPGITTVIDEDPA